MMGVVGIETLWEYVIEDSCSHLLKCFLYRGTEASRRSDRTHKTGNVNGHLNNDIYMTGTLHVL